MALEIAALFLSVVTEGNPCSLFFEFSAPKFYIFCLLSMGVCLLSMDVCLL